MARRILVALLALGTVSIVVVAVRIGSRPEPRHTFSTEHYTVQVSTVVTGLSHPWSLAFLPGGDMLVTERDGRLRRIHDGILQRGSLDGVPRVHSTGQEDLLDIALHPQFGRNRLLYLTYSKEGAKGTTIALATARLDGDALREAHDIFVADNWSRLDGNIGSRLTIRSSRHPLPPGNLFARPSQSSRARDPSDDRRRHETEHRPLGGDELNLIVRGRNYGFPAATYGRNYNGSIISHHTSLPGMESPLTHWVPSIAPSGLAIYTGDRFPKWRDNLFSGALAHGDVGMQLYRIDLTTSPLHIEPMLKPLGHRIRDVRQGPDGLLYLLTDEGNDRLLRIEPSSNH